MKTKITILTFLSFVAIIILSAFNGVNKHANGAPAGYTGSPADGKNCTYCHGGSTTLVTGFITSDVPVAGYTPGATYTITCAFSGTGNKGFEISPQSISGTALGSLVAGTGTHVLSNKYITHTSAISNASASWSFQWTAPASGTGDVTFYGACVIAQPNIKLTTLVVQENISAGIEDLINTNLSICPNPAKDALNINYKLPTKTKVEINLYSIDGREVETFIQEEQNQGDYFQRFNVSAYPQGLYFLEMKQNSKATVKKIIIN